MAQITVFQRGKEIVVRPYGYNGEHNGITLILDMDDDTVSLHLDSAADGIKLADAIRNASISMIGKDKKRQLEPAIA